MKNLSSINSVAIVTNQGKSQAVKAAQLLKKWLKRHGLKALSSEQLPKADLVVTLGGDGTILSIAPKAAQARVPVLGINMGRLGFLTAVESKKMFSAIQSCLRDEFDISERMMLDVQIPGHTSSQYALNDAVIRIGSTMRITRISAMIQNEEVGHFTGDGVIVATPTGSTAYSLAAQGPVVHPEVESLILTPVCPHSFTQRPVVFPSDQTLELKLNDQREGNEVQLCLDGQRVFHLKPGDVVKIRKSAFHLWLLQDPNVPYFKILREKLSWGGR